MAIQNRSEPPVTRIANPNCLSCPPGTRLSHRRPTTLTNHLSPWNSPSGTAHVFNHGSPGRHGTPTKNPHVEVMPWSSRIALATHPLSKVSVPLEPFWNPPKCLSPGNTVPLEHP